MIKREFNSKIQVRIRDLRFEHQNEDTLKTDLLDWQPDIVGFSSLSAESERTAYWCDFVRSVLPKAKVIIGGPYVSAFPIESIQKAKADVAFMRESERSLCAWLNCLLEGKPEHTVPGIVLWNEKGAPYITAPHEMIDDISTLPMPDWDAINFEDYFDGPSMNLVNADRKYTSISTSRGCPYNCVYCHHTQGKKVRYRDLKLVMEEISYLYHKYGIREFQIVDDIFNINKERVLELRDLLKESGMKIHISFPNGVRTDVLDEETIDALIESGTYSICFALEAASPRIQKLIKKNLDLEKAEKMIRYAYNRGVITKGFFMMGFVTETEEEVKQTVKFAINLPLLHAAFFTVAVQQNTELYEITKRHDPTFTVSKDSNYYGNLPSYINYDLPSIQKKAYLHFYLGSFRLFTYFYRFPRKLQFLKAVAKAGKDVLLNMK